MNMARAQRRRDKQGKKYLSSKKTGANPKVVAAVLIVGALFFALTALVR